MVEKTQSNGTQEVKKLEDFFIQNSEKEPEQRYGQSELDIIFESDSEDFLKNDILRTMRNSL